jgi:DNA-binding MarR family transcriptional regulator
MSQEHSKFYSKSLTFTLPILKMIDEDYTENDIAKSLKIGKSHVYYYVKRLKKLGYVEEEFRDSFKSLVVTQEGKNFVDQYTSSTSPSYICRLENVRFKAPVHTMPPVESLDWKKAQMNNWTQYGSKVDNIHVHLNDGKNPTIEFIPSAVDGDDPYKLLAIALYDCTKAAEKIEDTLRLVIGRLELSSRAEFVIYDPVAKMISKYLGQVTIDGIGKMNASGPKHVGEFEFHDPRACADYMVMPRRLHNMEQQQQRIQEELNKITDILTERRNSFGTKTV